MESASIWVGAARTATTSIVKAKKTKMVFIVRLVGKSKDDLRQMIVLVVGNCCGRWL